MSEKLNVFVSSAQKEMEEGRLLIQNLISTDPFLSVNYKPILYEFEPAAFEKATEGCLRSLDGCQVYLLIVGIEYGNKIDDLSITHHEYRHAKTKRLPILVLIKGARSLERDEGINELIAEIEKDGYKYKRFEKLVELQKEVRDALVKLLHDAFNIEPTIDENIIAEQTIEATSCFESQTLNRLSWPDLDHNLAQRLVKPSGSGAIPLPDDELQKTMVVRGLLYRDMNDGKYYATAAGILMLAKDPSEVFPQVRILADAYRSTDRDGEPRDQVDIRGPLPIMIDNAIDFVDRNTRHPMRVVGLNRVRLDEYPKEALREALVNAVAHRLYEDGGRRIILEVFSDRVVVSSPGLPPSPITIANLRSGKYRPCSRNPLIAQSLSYFQRIEERGSGFKRMRDLMLNHGLDKPKIEVESGYFEIILNGPGDNIDCIHVPSNQILVTPAIESELNNRQRGALQKVLTSGSVASGWMVKEFDITYDTANRDLIRLAALGILVREGKGRAAKYVYVTRKNVKEIF